MQQQQQGGESPYGVPPDMGPFSPPVASDSAMTLSSRPQPQPQVQQELRTSHEELGAMSAGAGTGFMDDEMLGDAGGGSGSSASTSNRWPREETLALIRIRSEMAATFRDATLKGPLWEDVSRKLGDLGYKRSAKKCKEKFENVHKYYKRTKEGRAGRLDGKSYRFFSELEALHAAGTTQQQKQLPPASGTSQKHAFATPVSAPPLMNSLPPPTGPMQPVPISSAAPAPAPMELPLHKPVNLQGLSFSSMSDSESDSESDDDVMVEMGGRQDRLGKRKRGGSKKMISFFEGLMQQVVERQEAMQRRFLETMEKREAERTAREEAWRRQEVTRLNREQDQLAQERAAAASRDAAIVAFLQRVGGQNVQAPTAVVVPMAAQKHAQTPPPPKQATPQKLTPTPPQATPLTKPICASPLQQQPPPLEQHKETSHHNAAGMPRGPHLASRSGASLDMVTASEQHGDSALGGEGGTTASSRWPKAEVHALIQIRMELDMRYQETGPKGPLWEEISTAMRCHGYNRSSKRCKEKWENINKYYKKVKESNKKRPEDSKTCPYFHQLEAIYRKKQLTGSTTSSATNAVTVAEAPSALPEQLNQSTQEIEGKNINNDKRNNGGSGGINHMPTGNGKTSTATTGTLDADSTLEKPEDIVRELTEQPPRELTADETDSDDMGEYTDDGEEGEDDGKMQYRIQFQKPNQGGTNNTPAPTTTTTPAVPATAPTMTNTFSTMVQ